MAPIIECVPNFSEGRNPLIIQSITSEIERGGVRLLNVDPGKATNRQSSLCRFTGSCVAAALAIRKAGELIDMRQHHGEIPGWAQRTACPLIPVSGISMDETAHWAHKLAERAGKSSIPAYLYEAAQRIKNEIICRLYVQVSTKDLEMKDPAWLPMAHQYLMRNGGNGNWRPISW
jgi:glutamate formiminotransferase/formiminotetrahydrofolate cyclodeaminase